MIERDKNGNIPYNLKPSYELQLVDCNCNDCVCMLRDSEKLKEHKKSYEGTGLMDGLQFGYCMKFDKEVSFLPNTCQIETQECFTHRKDG